MYLLFIFLGFLLVGSIAFGIYYSLASGKDNFREWREIELSQKQRILWLCNIIALLLSVWFTVYCLIVSEAFGAFALLIWLFTSLAAAQVCSPLKPFSFLDGSSGQKSGCAGLLMSPLLWITSTVSGIIAMLTSWLFCIITILRKATVPFKVIACLLIAASVITPTAVVFGIDYAEQKQIEEAEQEKAEIVNGIINKFNAAYDSGKLEKIVFDAEELAYCESEDTDPYFVLKSSGVVEKKISELYNKKDFKGMLNIARISAANGYGFDVKVTGDVYDFIKSEILENGEYKSTNSFSGIKTYSFGETGEYEVSLDSEYIKVTCELYSFEAWFWLYEEGEEIPEYHTEYWVVGETATDILNTEA